MSTQETIRRKVVLTGDGQFGTRDLALFFFTGRDFFNSNSLN
jgi:hypothetical protein